MVKVRFGFKLKIEPSRALAMAQTTIIFYMPIIIE
jgi:hypothetical protein